MQRKGRKILLDDSWTEYMCLRMVLVILEKCVHGMHKGDFNGYYKSL